jgi:RNA polymerase-binding transcription factor DksA
MGNEIVRYSNADLEEFKVLIEKRLERANRQISQLQEQLQDLFENNENGYDLDDNSSLDQEKDILQTMLQRQQKHGNDLENALIRIRNKTYGICEVSGKLIDKRRLLAVPTTTKSLEAKQQLAKTEDPRGRRQQAPKKHRINRAALEAVTKKQAERLVKEDEFEDLNYKEEGIDNDFDDDSPTGKFVDLQEDEPVDPDTV